MYLSNHTYFSLRYGTLSPSNLVQLARTLGQKTLILTDINNTSAAYEFVRLCKECNIKPILGVEIRQDHAYYYTVIAKDADGFAEICELLTDASRSDMAMSRIAPSFKRCFVIYRHLPKPPTELLAHEYVGIRPQEVGRLYRSDLLTYKQKLVVFNPIVFANETGKMVHRLLRAIDMRKLISQLQADDYASNFDIPMTESQITEAFQQYPEIIDNTRFFLDTCEAKMESCYENNRKTYSGSAEKDKELLTTLALEGCQRRFGTDNSNAVQRTKKELEVIFELGFCSYFLITWDMIQYAKGRGYYHVGRGSGANSIVAYNLMITDVDPLELDLYFERFINPHRVSPPDFDIDFSWDERDDVTNYVIDKYGTEHVALLATYNTFKGKSIIRELGKVFGLEKVEIDTIVKHPLDRTRHHPFAEKIFYYGKFLENFPNYLSIHAGGLIIADKPLRQFTALQYMPKGFPITHFDMFTAERLGFHKYDVLSQRGLGHIKDAVRLIKLNRGKAVDIRDISRIKRDPSIRKLLLSGDCVGCFYIESPAMRALLKKLRCDNYVHLIAASSIIRPGVAKSGMMREYIERSHDPSKVSYLHPIFAEHLKETYGIMVYQEDVMRIVHYFAGLDLNECDVLRRMMTGKKTATDTFIRLRARFHENCRDRGYSEELVQEVWRQIESFSGYSFCKAHSATFAVESYQSLYLKAHYPLEFIVAVINNFGGFYSTEVYVREAKILGGIIEPPCVNRSWNLTHLYGKIIYLGLTHIISLQALTINHIIEAREASGPFLSLEDFVQRVDIASEQLSLLIRIGAFRFTGLSKYELMWEKLHLEQSDQAAHGTGTFFELSAKRGYNPPIITEHPLEQALDEIELLGFCLCSPFKLLDSHMKGDIIAKEMIRNVGKTLRIIGYFVIKKDVTTTTGKHMNFGTWMDEEGAYFDTTHFPISLDKYPFLGSGCYCLRGKIVEEFGFPSMEVYQMDKLPIASDQLRSQAG